METKTRATFTPGPWNIEKRGTSKTHGAIYAGPKTSRFGVRNFFMGIDAIMPIADACLIAAAPDLYAALMDCTDGFEAHASDSHPLDARIISSARAALAKARGGTP